MKASLVERKKDCKVDDLVFCSQLLAEVNLHSSAEQKPPLKNPRSATDFILIVFSGFNSTCAK